VFASAVEEWALAARSSHHAVGAGLVRIPPLQTLMVACISMYVQALTQWTERIDHIGQ
jgi:hypothetical protein